MMLNQRQNTFTLTQNIILSIIYDQIIKYLRFNYQLQQLFCFELEIQKLGFRTLNKLWNRNKSFLIMRLKISQQDVIYSQLFYCCCQ
ncbi:unnamed protein product [Paramecium sonneborni]|uniref:Uncharacterized protein n=1 Tax=Paramecium sonneborni TaxID=65129 RepID=A0A8S1RLL9_9CILI|nr:unnamed protein product [Paramecium sonneborni]